MRTFGLFVRHAFATKNNDKKKTVNKGRILSDSSLKKTDINGRITMATAIIMSDTRFKPIFKALRLISPEGDYTYNPSLQPNKWRKNRYNVFRFPYR
jgi:hypothetical protein